MTAGIDISATDWAAIAAAAAAFVALGFNAYANALVAKTQSLQNTYDFLSRLERCTDALIAANVRGDVTEHKRARARAINFLEATCHGLNNNLFVGASHAMASANTINLIAALEIVAPDAISELATADSYSDIASFAEKHRKAINTSKCEQRQAGITV